MYVPGTVCRLEYVNYFIKVAMEWGFLGSRIQRPLKGPMSISDEEKDDSVWEAIC